MKTWILKGLMVAATFASTGCYTAAYGSAYTQDPNYQYVAGRQGNPAQMWICPTKNTGEQCRVVQVIRR